MPLSQSLIPFLLAIIIATTFIGYGLNAIFRPQTALEPFSFKFHPSTLTQDQNLINGLLIIYGARDVFMGFTIYAAAFSGKKNRRLLGWMLIFASAVAGVDGWVCLVHAPGLEAEWNHWGYAPVVFCVGMVLVGVLG